MVQDHSKSERIFLVKYTPGPYLKFTLLQEQVYHMVLEQYAFQVWSWNISNLEYSSRLSMVQNYKVLMVQDHKVLDHKSGPKSQKRYIHPLHDLPHYTPTLTSTHPTHPSLPRTHTTTPTNTPQPHTPSTTTSQPHPYIPPHTPPPYETSGGTHRPKHNRGTLQMLGSDPVDVISSLLIFLSFHCKS